MTSYDAGTCPASSVITPTHWLGLEQEAVVELVLVAVAVVVLQKKTHSFHACSDDEAILHN